MSLPVQDSRLESSAAAAPARRRFEKMAVVPELTGLSRAASYELTKHPVFKAAFLRIGRCIRVDVAKLEALLSGGGSAEPIRAPRRRSVRTAS